MSEAELAWVAGLLEGEGCFILTKVYRPKQYTYPVIACTMTDLDVLERLLALTGVGRLRGPYQRPNRKPDWRWQLQRQAESRDLMTKLLPLMGERRSAKIREVLEATKSVGAISRGRQY